MDIERPDLLRQKRRTRTRYAVAAAIVVALAAVGISQLKPALPVVERGGIWVDQVKRGTVVRQVRGGGTFVPFDVNWISAATEARVERIVAQPGSAVVPDAVIVELADSAQLQRELDAHFQLIAAEADAASLRKRLESDQLDAEAAAGKLKAEANQSRLRADADEEMARQGVLPELSRRLSRSSADELAHRSEMEAGRLRISRESAQTQLAAQQAKVDALRAQYELQRSRSAALHVRAGIAGVLQQVSVEVGQRVTPGTVLAKVVEPSRLKAAVKIAETQARDVQIGQSAILDTHNGTLRGRVIRIDPAAQNGTVTVDIAPDEALPKGARPDAAVDAVIELERLSNVLYVTKPVHAEEETKGTLFRLDPAQTSAERVAVRFGRSSVNSIEIVEGLREGDRVIVSDTSRWDGNRRIRIE